MEVFSVCVSAAAEDPDEARVQVLRNPDEARAAHTRAAAAFDDDAVDAPIRGVRVLRVHVRNVRAVDAPTSCVRGVPCRFHDPK